MGDIAILQDHTILFPYNATFSIYVATNFFSNFTEKCQYYQQTKVQLIFYPFLDKKFSKKSSFSSLSCSWCKDSSLSCTSLCFALKSMFPQNHVCLIYSY